MNKRRKKRSSSTEDRSPLASGLARNRLVLDIISTDTTFELFTFRDGERVWVGKCIHCNARMTVGTTGETGFTVEHITPRYAGGTNELQNLALACGGCNNEKGRRHDQHVGKEGRADDVVTALRERRLTRWREPR